MSIAESRLTAQGQISVPAEVRRRMGLGPGSVLVWEERDGEFVVRRAAKCTSADMHAALFGDRQPRSTRRPTVKDGVRQYIRRRHARG
jgi:antitoxin PrlF